jgi:hypothetical protein
MIKLLGFLPFPGVIKGAVTAHTIMIRQPLLLDVLRAVVDPAVELILI